MPSAPRSREAAVGHRAGQPVARRRLAQRPAPGCGRRRTRPHEATNEKTTWSPTASPVTPLTEGFDNAGALVAEHDRPAPGSEQPVGEVEIGVADAGGGHPDQHLVAARRLQQHTLADDRPSGLAQHCGPHLDRGARTAPGSASEVSVI